MLLNRSRMISDPQEVRVMQWREVISDFQGLAKQFVEKFSQNKAAEELAHDKKTIRGWCEGAQPSIPVDVGWLINRAMRSGIDIGQFQTFAPIYDFAPLLTYEEKIQRGLPDLSWLTGVQAPPQISTDFFDFNLDTPLGLSS